MGLDTFDDCGRAPQVLPPDTEAQPLVFHLSTLAAMAGWSPGLLWRHVMLTPPEAAVRQGTHTLCRPVVRLPLSLPSFSVPPATSTPGGSFAAPATAATSAPGAAFHASPLRSVGPAINHFETLHAAFGGPALVAVDDQQFAPAMCTVKVDPASRSDRRAWVQRMLSKEHPAAVHVLLRSRGTAPCGAFRFAFTVCRAWPVFVHAVRQLAAQHPQLVFPQLTVGDTSDAVEGAAAAVATLQRHPELFAGNPTALALLFEEDTRRAEQTLESIAAWRAACLSEEKALTVLQQEPHADRARADEKKKGGWLRGLFRTAPKTATPPAASPALSPRCPPADAASGCANCGRSSPLTFTLHDEDDGTAWESNGRRGDGARELPQAVTELALSVAPVARQRLDAQRRRAQAADACVAAAVELSTALADEEQALQELVTSLFVIPAALHVPRSCGAPKWVSCEEKDLDECFGTPFGSGPVRQTNPLVRRSSMIGPSPPRYSVASTVDGDDDYPTSAEVEESLQQSVVHATALLTAVSDQRLTSALTRPLRRSLRLVSMVAADTAAFAANSARLCDATLEASNRVLQLPIDAHPTPTTDAHSNAPTIGPCTQCGSDEDSAAQCALRLLDRRARALLQAQPVADEEAAVANGTAHQELRASVDFVVSVSRQLSDAVSKALAVTPEATVTSMAVEAAAPPSLQMPRVVDPSNPFLVDLEQP